MSRPAFLDFSTCPSVPLFDIQLAHVNGPLTGHEPTLLRNRPALSRSPALSYPCPQDFSSVAERTGTYTAFDYADIMDHLIDRWAVGKREGLSGEAAEAQEYLVKLPERIRKLAERANARKKKGQTANFSWIFNRQVTLH